MNIELTCASCERSMCGNIIVAENGKLSLISPTCYCSKIEEKESKISALLNENFNLRQTCKTLDKELSHRTRDYQNLLAKYKRGIGIE